MADKMVKVSLTTQRMYRARPEDREAITVGPGEVEVPEWVALAWETKKAPAPSATPSTQYSARIVATMNAIVQCWELPTETLEGDGPVSEEVVATFLEMMAAVEPGPRISEILEIEGMSKTSVKAIMKHFNLEESDGHSE